VKAVASQSPSKYERTPRPTSFSPFEARVRALLAETPEMPATVIAERVGWTGSIRWFRDNVRRLRPEQRPVDPADRLSWEPGDAAQCDLWFPPKELIHTLGRAPRRLIWGNEPGIGRGHRRAEGVSAFAGTLATRILRVTLDLE
jgi:hypothetical protein